MSERIRLITKDLVVRLQEFDVVEAITLTGEMDVPWNDPYFYMSFDVYCSGSVPDPSDRRGLFLDAGAFETSSYAKKDRFLLNDLPVRIEYKSTARIDEILSWSDDNLWNFRQTGTYMFYRLKYAEILFERFEWLAEARRKLTDIPENFWKLLEKSCMTTLEHYLSDLEAAVLKDDRLFYTISAGSYIKNLCSMLYVVNRKFEPSGRQLYEGVGELQKAPENFKGRFESFISEDSELTPTRKMELASLLAKSVIRLVS